MLQREGRRVRAGLEEDALERSVSQSLSVCVSASSHLDYREFIVSVRAGDRVSCASARVCTSASVCFTAQVSKHSERLQTNALINHRDGVGERKKRDDTRAGETGSIILSLLFLSLLYLFNVFWVNIRQAMGGDCCHIFFAFTRRKLISFPLLSPYSDRSHHHHYLPPTWQFLSPISN